LKQKGKTGDVDIFKEITSFNNLRDAYEQSQKGDSKYKNESMIFEQNVTQNLLDIQKSLIEGTYEFSGYTRFKVFEPKERIIDAPCLKDKIVQLAINNVIKKVINPKFIYNSYACIDNKGTHKAVYKSHHYMRKAYWQYGEDTTIIKLDLKKYFYSIDRSVTKREFKKYIECEKTLNLIFKIINSADSISDLGLPLGNTLSQIGANLTLNPLDNYAKRDLSLKYYVRYADDIFIIVESKEKAKETLLEIKNYIENELNLKLNKRKTKIFPIDQGVNGLGFKIYRTHILLRNESKKKMKRKLKKIPNLIKKGDMTIEKAEQMLNSWKGHADYACSYNFYMTLVNKFSFLELKNDKFIVLESEL